MEAVSGSDRAALARAIASAAASVPGVARLSPGIGVPVATQYPGGRTVGVALRPSAVSVHVAVDQLPMEPVITEVVEEVSRVLADVADPRRVEVVVEDVEDEAFADFVDGRGGRPGEAR